MLLYIIIHIYVIPPGEKKIKSEKTLPTLPRSMEP